MTCVLNFVDQRLHGYLGLGRGSLVIGRRLDFNVVTAGSPVPLAEENTGDNKQNQERDSTCYDHYLCDSGQRLESLIVCLWA